MLRKLFFICLLLVISSLFSLNIEFLTQSTVTTNVVTVFDLTATFNGIEEDTLKNINLVFLPDNKAFDLDIRYVLFELSKIATDITATPTTGTIWISNVKSQNPSTLTEELAKEIALKSVLSKLPTQSEATITSLNGTITKHDNFSIDIISNETGTFIVKFNLFENDTLVGLYSINIFAKHLKKVYIATRDIYFGELVTPESVMETYINDLNMFGTNIKLTELPLVAKKNFKAGEPIFKEYLQKIPYTVENQIIEGYVIVNGVLVKAKFKLLEDGDVGEAVKAINIETGKIVVGIIEEGPKLFILK